MVEFDKLQDIYNRRYDYDDMKIAICIADFCKISPQLAEEMEDFEDIISLAVDIKDKWQADTALTKDEYAHIQVYANRYLIENYVKGE